MPDQPFVPQAIKALSEVTPGYDAIFCDVWGVLHDGISKYPEADGALRAARAAGLPVVLVTNSPRRAASVAAFLASLGIGGDTFDFIATSGDVTRALIKAAPPRLFHIGLEAHVELFDGLGVERVDEQSAEVIVVTGLAEDRQLPEDYDALLRRLAVRELPLICANPDVVAPRGDRLVWGAGALARDYAALGGKVLQAGKPFGPIYDMAVSQIGGIENKRVLAIGDGFPTDIRGANDYGLDVLLILEGIHADELGDDMHSVARALEKESLSARYAMTALR
jgi:HAD superfamily hydrolase (TIGR01459 family)